MRKSKIGYTLIEMIMVIAIIVLLAGVGIYGVVDSVKDYKAQAKLVAEHNNGFEGEAAGQIGEYRGDSIPGVNTATPSPSPTTTPTPEPTQPEERYDENNNNNNNNDGDTNQGGDQEEGTSGESISLPNSSVNLEYASYDAGKTGCAVVGHGNIDVTMYSQVIITVRTIGDGNKTFTRTLTGTTQGSTLFEWQYSPTRIDINDTHLSGVEVVSVTAILK